jgi:cobalt/nickel transport system permease protein
VSTLHDGLYELGRLDGFASGDTAVHRVDPRVKVLTTLIFIVCVVSFPRYSVTGMVPFVIFPVALAAEGRIPLRWLGSRLRIAAPFALLVGVFNPLLDREVVASVGGVALSGGIVSYASIIARFLLTTAAALLLIATTGFTSVCNALERMRVPDVFATQLLFLYRYIFVLGEEALTMSRARDLRSFGTRGQGLRIFGLMLGQLLLRTYARAQRIYSAMLLRGFDGTVRTRRVLHFRASDAAFLLGWSALFLTLRFINVPLAIGTIVTRLVTGAL